MAQNPPHVVYVGLQKTGSTYLRHYFYNHPDIFCSRHGKFFQTDAADVAQHGSDGVRSRYEALFAAEAAKPCRIDMYEAIGMGYVLKGIDDWSEREFLRVNEALNARHIVYAPRQMAERVHAAAPDAKVLLTIRNQAGWIDSNYRHYFEQIPTEGKTLADFLSTPEGKLVLDVAAFDRVVDIYDQLFGADRVLVLPLERLENEEDAAFRELCAFLGVAQVSYRRDDKNLNQGRPLDALKNVYAKPAGWLDRWVGRGCQAPDKQYQEMLGHLSRVYAASNARLSSRLGVNLADLGYPA